MLKRPWMVEIDPDKADFIIATEHSRCAENEAVELIDEVKRFDRTFAWVYFMSQVGPPSVAALAASADARPPGVTIRTATCRRTRSAAGQGGRSI